MELDKVRHRLKEMVPEYHPTLSQETLSWLRWRTAGQGAELSGVQVAQT
jgi:hypothetical protein